MLNQIDRHTIFYSIKGHKIHLNEGNVLRLIDFYTFAVSNERVHFKMSILLVMHQRCGVGGEANAKPDSM